MSAMPPNMSSIVGRLQRCLTDLDNLCDAAVDWEDHGFRAGELEPAWYYWVRGRILLLQTAAQALEWVIQLLSTPPAGP